MAAAGRRRAARVWPLAAPGVALVSLVSLPFVWLSLLSFVADGSLSLANYARMVENPSYQTIVLKTLQLSAVVTIVVIAVGYPTAYFIHTRSRITATVLLACVAIPFWTSLLVRTYAWMVILQRNGIVNGWLQDIGLIERPLRLSNSFLGTSIGMIHIMLPFFIFPLYSAMKQIDMDLVRAARSLGASRTKAFWQVFVPLSGPGLFAGSLLTFVLCLGFYVTPQLLGGGNVTVISMKIQENITNYSDWGAASALGVVLLVVVAGLLLGVKKLGARLEAQ
ncbi:MAG TPA: ABC transporter permease [Dongiaceae bacterium]|jgi:putative spermidine/putrescine transport system permease protein/spermidine/putrescine transport system permease protein|nr:ABC transporter permease [Dongiaceae bacterium]